MADADDSKVCTTCKQSKLLTAFYKATGRKLGRCDQCIDCMKDYARRYRQSESAKALRNAASKRYRATEAGKAKRRERQRTKYAADVPYRELLLNRAKARQRTETGRAQNNARTSAYRKRHPERVAARSAVNHAIESGALPKATERACEKCGVPATEYHHHAGYSKENWLNVIAVCKSCHWSIEHLTGLDRL